MSKNIQNSGDVGMDTLPLKLRLIRVVGCGQHRSSHYLLN